jgi:hypothetical protein
MGVQENDDESVNLLEVQHEVKEEEPIEQVFSQEAENISTVEPSIESEDQERFGETATFEEEIDTPKVHERKPQREKAIKSKFRKIPKNESKDKPVSKLHDELRKHSDARKQAEKEILDIRKELKDLLLVHHATIKDLQKQVAQMHRKIATIDNPKKSARVKTNTKKKTLKKKTSSSKQSKKKSRKH